MLNLTLFFAFLRQCSIAKPSILLGLVIYSVNPNYPSSNVLMLEMMSENRSYDFYEQLEKAIPDEKLTIEHLKKTPKFSNLDHKMGKKEKSDAYDSISDEWLEIKVDYTTYPNHFIERFSFLEENKVGGPWQYFQRGVKYYVFFYKKLGHIYVFETKTLIKKMENLIENKIISDEIHGRKVKQKNADYHTYGYKVKKELIDDICILKLINCR